ncbi:MAG: type IV pili methyl-accepting chemotaxis transducer N-terminal domain-containing protein, partial [Pseudomonadota bacterium]
MQARRQIEPGRWAIRYLLAIALLVAFVLAGHGLHIATGKQGALDEEVINISGRQRMLSQRIVLSATRYNDTGTR